MRQAQTLNEAQFRRVLHYCRSRRHPVRDTTIFMVSFYAGPDAPKRLRRLN
jgi:integrase/recombinase XerD